MIDGNNPLLTVENLTKHFPIKKGLLGRTTYATILNLALTQPFLTA